MFQSQKVSDPSPAPSKPATASSRKPQHSIIGTDLKITGDIVSSGDITVHGTVEGSITCRSLTLGDAPVISAITAETVRISGVFDGEVKAQKVSLGRNARVTGNIYHESLEVEAGASIEGKLARLGGKKAADSSTVTALEQPAKVSNG
jgi:cytoskeletal protein CcmA (bactofilin family)